MTEQNSKNGPIIIGCLVLILLILHQDNWFWESKTLVFGFMPIGLFWHACISIGASATWFAATKIAWPADDAMPEMAASDNATSSSAQQEEAN